MQLENFINTYGSVYILDGVDTYIENVKSFGVDAHASYIRFRLNGIVYIASEDPDDGYRSHLKNIIIQETSEITNYFSSILVTAQWKPDDKKYGMINEVIQLIDNKNNKVVLEFGTKDCNDYYPSFVENFYPENMSTNS